MLEDVLTADAEEKRSRQTTAVDDHAPDAAAASNKLLSKNRSYKPLLTTFSHVFHFKKIGTTSVLGQLK